MKQTTLLILIAIIALPTFAQAQLNKYPIPYRKGDKWGYCDEKKNIIVEPIYQRATPIYELHDLSFGIVAHSYSNNGIVDSSGNIILPTEYYFNGASIDIGAFIDERTNEKIHYMIAWKEGGKGAGIVSLDGKNTVLVPFEYSLIRLNIIRENYLWCTGRKDGQLYEIHPLTGEANKLTEDERMAKYVDPYMTDRPMYSSNVNIDKVILSDNLIQNALLKNQNKFTRIDENILNWKRYENFETGYFMTDRHFYKIYNNDKVGIVEKSELQKIKVEQYVKPQYDSIVRCVYPTPFESEYYFIAIKDGKAGVITYNSDIIVPFEYDEIKYYRGGFILKINEKMGLADPDRKVFIPAKYEYIAPLMNFEEELDTNNHLFMVTHKHGIDLIGYVNRFGIEYFEDEKSIKATSKVKEYDSIVIPENESFKTKVIQKDGKWGMIDKDGKVIIPIEYKIIETSQGVIVTTDSSGKNHLFNYFGTLYLNQNIYRQLASFPEKQVYMIEYYEPDGSIMSMVVRYDFDKQEIAEILLDSYSVIARTFIGNQYYFIATNMKNRERKAFKVINETDEPIRLEEISMDEYQKNINN